MTVRMTISLPDGLAAEVEQLVREGRYASNSDVVREGLRALSERRLAAARAQAEHEARLEAIRQDLQQRADGPFLSQEEMTARLEESRRRRRKAQDTNAS